MRMRERGKQYKKCKPEECQLKLSKREESKPKMIKDEDHPGNNEYCWTKDNIEKYKKYAVMYELVIIEDYLEVCRESTITENYFEFAMALGCGKKRKDVDDCVRRWPPSVIGSGPMDLEQVYQVRGSQFLMSEIVSAIDEMNRQQNESQHEPTEEEKQQAQAQENATSNPTWKYTAGGIGFWDYGNGFGWAPPNPIRDRIIMGLSISNHAKRMLITGPKGRPIFIPR